MGILSAVVFALQSGDVCWHGEQTTWNVGLKGGLEFCSVSQWIVLRLGLGELGLGWVRLVRFGFGWLG